MSWKDVLVFADGSDNGLARAHMAAALGAQIDASVEICIPRVLPPVMASGGAGFAAYVMDEVCDASAADAAAALARVKTIAPGFGDRVRMRTPEIAAASLARLAGALSRHADAVIVGQPIEADASRNDDAILEGALMRSGRPCIVVPRWPEPRVWARRILIAWKGSREAARAVHDALPILSRADDVAILAVGEGAEIDGDGTMGVASLSRHLRRHGVNAYRFKIAPAGNVGAAILAEQEAWGADMVVMGGYGQSAISERVFGGATRSLLRASPVPVLMSH